MGVVRKRDVVTHASRLDTDAYEAHINRNPGQNEGPYAVVGDGIVGSAVARMLHDHGFDVCIVASASNRQQAFASLNADEGNMFPSWMEERVASMCEQNDIDTVGDVAEFLRDGLTVSDAVPEGGLVVHEDEVASDEPEELASLMHASMWQAVGKVWQLNTAAKRPSGSIQTKLV
jgi:glycine/D-amino acid oxidase-like deaminating enzyme